jgi:hypothetical protein
MAAFLHGNGQILWDIAMNTTYVHLINFLALGSRYMFNTNNKAVDYLFRALCQSEFDRVQIEDLACRILLELKNARTGNAEVPARLYATYQREYENFTHLLGEFIDVWFQWFMVVVNNMRANVDVLPYDDHNSDVKLLDVLDRTMWDRKVKVVLEFDKYTTLTVHKCSLSLSLLRLIVV